MKDSKSEILDELAGKGDGMTVPDGYFEDFMLKMSAQLPFREELDTPVAERKPARNSGWMRIRPYVYMAAMFAGAWCLIKMFSLMSPSANDVSISNYPALSLALEDEQFVDEYVLDGVSTYDIMEDSYYSSLGVDPDADDMTDGTDGDYAAAPPASDNAAPGYILPTDGDYSSAPYNNDQPK